MEVYWVIFCEGGGGGGGGVVVVEEEEEGGISSAFCAGADLAVVTMSFYGIRYMSHTCGV